jgi:hypothetical protein
VAERDLPILNDTERVWIIVILLGFLWLGPALPGGVWIALAATAVLAALFLFPFGREWVRRLPGFIVVLTVLIGLHFFEIAKAVVTGPGLILLGIQEFWIIATEEPGAMLPPLVVLAVIAFVLVRARHPLGQWFQHRTPLEGASFELAAQGLFIPLILCGGVSLWTQSASARNLGIPLRAAVALLFLFHFYTYWPKKRWVGRWLFFILFSSLGGGVDILELSLYLPYLSAGPNAAVAGFLQMVLWDFPRVLFSFNDPGVRGFFLGQSLPLLPDEIIDSTTRLLDGLTLFESAGFGLCALIALALPPLAALRLVRGEIRARPMGYVLWCLAFSVATAPLWGSLVNAFLYRPLFLGQMFFFWVTRGLLLQAALSVALFLSRPLAMALAGGAVSMDQQKLEPNETTPAPNAPYRGGIRSRLKAGFRFILREEVLLPILCVILVLSAFAGALCANGLNRAVGRFHGVIDPRPGEIAAAPILEPVCTKKVSPRIGLFGYPGTQKAQRKTPIPLEMINYPTLKACFKILLERRPHWPCASGTCDC